MKKIIGIIVLFIFTLSCNAQKVRYKKGIIYKDDKEFLKIKKEGTTLIKNLRVKNLKDKSLIFARAMDNGTYYKLTFEGFDEVAYLEGNMRFGNILAKTIVDYNLVNENQELNPKSIKEITTDFATKPNIEEPIKNTVNNIPVDDNANTQNQVYFLVERNKSDDIDVYGEDIKQDFKTIGTVKENFVNNSYHFYLPNGTLVAEVRYEDAFSNVCKITTTQDNRFYELNIQRSSDVKEKIARFLVDRLYL